jgi:invasion protein IalB
VNRILAAFLLGTTLLTPVVSVWAQEAATEEQATEEQAPATDEAQPEAEAPAAADAPAEADDAATDETPAAPNEADQAFPVTGAPVEPEFTTEEFGAWELRCTADNKECFLYQLITNDAGDPVSEISIIALPAGGEAVTGATVVTPLGTLLPAGITFRVDSGEPRQYPFSWCLRSGCFSRFGLPAQGLASLKAGSVAHMRLAAIDIPEQPIDLEISLSGFTAAYNALVERKASAE